MNFSRNTLLTRIAALLVILYGTFAGVRKLDDPDMWWQMASGRHVAASGHVLRTEVFSYTANGAPWTYPIGAGLLFHWLYTLGGFPLLSLLSPLAGAAIAVLIVRKGGLLRCLIAAIAIPVISMSTVVRANMFTTLLAAVFLTLLWDDRGRWLLPILMLLWVNLHPGFIYGLAMLVLFAAIRPRRWMLPAATLLATLVNPWGWRIYQAIVQQGEAMPIHQAFIVEWSRTPVSMEVFARLLDWRDPACAFWWLMLVALAAVLLGLSEKRFLGALLLTVSAGAALAYYRFQALFAVAAAVIAADLIGPPCRELLRTMLAPPNERAETPPRSFWSAAFLTALLALLVGVRISDLATNRYYFSHPIWGTFGVGVANWFPDRAARFIEDHHLPREIYHDYSMGGYLTWRLAPRYPVFIDGRALPYGENQFLTQQQMMVQGPDAPEGIWKAAVERWKIRTIIVSVSRFGGFTGLPLPDFCRSSSFRLVYLDETAAVFVAADDRNVPALDCRTAVLQPPPDSASMEQRYLFWANAGRLYNVLGRLPECENAIAHARAIFDDDPAVHLDLAQLRRLQGRIMEADAEFRQALAMEPLGPYWRAYGGFLQDQQRLDEAMECYRRSAADSLRPNEAWSELAQLALSAGKPKVALDAADRALASSPFQGDAAGIGTEFTAGMMGVRGQAFMAMLQADRAAEAYQQALGAGSKNPRRLQNLYLGLGEACFQAGRIPNAQNALKSADDLIQKTGPASQNIIARREHLEWLLKSKHNSP